jgi:hypothetical protein
MRLKLHHPLWTHFGKHGLPDSWGSPLDIWLIMIGLPLLLVIGSAVLDK